jgi:DivIVA domain-containing protein
MDEQTGKPQDEAATEPKAQEPAAPVLAQWTAPTPPPTSEAIRTATFRTVRKGFDPKEVGAYLARVSREVEGLQRRLRLLEAATPGARLVPPSPVPAPVPQPARPQQQPAQAKADDAYKNAASSIAELMRRFDADVRNLKREAEAEAERSLTAARADADRIRQEAAKLRQTAEADATAMIAQARSDADKIVEDAQGRADELDGAAQRALRDARLQADEVMRNIAAGRQSVIDDLRKMRDGLVETLARLDRAIDERVSDDVVVVKDEPEIAPTP